MLGSTRVPKAVRKARKKPALQPKKRPLQARSRTTYESLLDAAARLLEQRGYAALTTNHVADAAGVAIGSLYEYFPSKEVIVAEVVRRTMAEVAQEVGESFRSAIEQHFELGLSTWVNTCFQAVSRRAKLMRVLWMDVPFLWELQEVQQLPLLLLAIARQGLPDATSPWLLKDPEAATYLLTVMIRAAIVEGVVARPAHLSLSQVQTSLTELLQQVLLVRGRP
jgi:AcrR family transcriptional regulator